MSKTRTAETYERTESNEAGTDFLIYRPDSTHSQQAHELLLLWRGALPRRGMLYVLPKTDAEFLKAVSIQPLVKEVGKCV